MKKDLPTPEIEAASTGSPDTGREHEPEVSAFDFGRLDRIPKSQLRALHLVHENFVRSLASSLSAYLRSYLALNLVSLEQISYSEFLETISPPTCLAYLGLQPYEGTAVLELNMGLMFSLIELLLGSKGQSTLSVQREITDIEKSLVQTLLKVVLRDLTEAWKSVADVSFLLQSLASEPQLLHVLAPAEAVIVIAIEVKVEGTSGLMNLAIPSIFIKRLRTKFDLLRQVRKAESTEDEQYHVARILQSANVSFGARIDAGQISAQDLFNLKVNDVLILDYPRHGPVSGLINSKDLCRGEMVVTEGGEAAFRLTEEIKGESEISESAGKR